MEYCVHVGVEVGEDPIHSNLSHRFAAPVDHHGVQAAAGHGRSADDFVGGRVSCNCQGTAGKGMISVPGPVVVMCWNMSRDPAESFPGRYHRRFGGVGGVDSSLS